MKNNLLFILVLVALFATALGALYYQYRFGDFGQEITEEAVVEDQDILLETEVATPAGELAEDEELQAMPEVSESDELDVILQELEETVILEEDFADL
jgi:hypothetical protein